MKLKLLQSALLASSLSFASSPSPANYTVHEWGTFTSVQGGDGNLLSWRARQVAELPGFVYDWTKPGLNRRTMPTFSKVVLETLQRMETPVVYFYADQPMNVDLDVTFPKGSITDWYPQATQIGPSIIADANGPSDGIASDSRIVWRGMELVPESKTDDSLQAQLPQDSSGSHYFAARATSANVIRAHFPTSTNAVTEFEKFLFYRGSGSFKTPLRVTVGENNMVTIKNEGSEELAALFLITIHKTNTETYGTISSAKNLAGGRSIEWPFFGRLAHNWRGLPLPEFQTEIAAKIEIALIDQGLFPDEAEAMVNTWKDSWFTEEGVRVLYILPRPWTDETLPMTLNPQPKNLTRVMVGRAEIITPNVEANLFQLLTQAQNGDTSAHEQASVELKKMGRFAEPALRLAYAHAEGTNRINIWNLGYQLITSSRSTFE